MRFDRGAAQPPSCMGIVDEAGRLEREGRPIVHLEKGELDIDTPEVIKEGAVAALRANKTRYSHSTGVPELRAAICQYYDHVYGVSVEPSQVIVNAGSSPAMLELFLAVLAPGDEVILPNPCYPAYPSFVEAVGGTVVWAHTAMHGFVHAVERVAPLVSPATRAVFLNFPSNPVGTTLDDVALRRFTELRRLVVSDEVYHGLLYDGSLPHTILEFTDNAVVVGSFSKSFLMTGWRLGYLIVPPWLVNRMVRLHQDLFVGTNTFVQWAAIAALEHAEEIQQQLRDELRLRSKVLMAGLTSLGFEVPCVPSGGFYVFARQPPSARQWSSAEFAADLLERTHVAITPGSEFGPDGEGYVRFSLSSACPQIEEALDRIATFLDRNRPAPTELAVASRALLHQNLSLSTRCRSSSVTVEGRARP